MRSTKGVVTVTKGERKSAEGTKGKSGTENVNRQRRKNVGGIERIAAPRDRERVRGKEREGIIFAREGCAVRHAAAQNHPLRPAPLRAFSSLFLALLAVLFFFSRRAAVAARALLFIPVDRVDFSFRASAQPRPRATMAACPKIRRWGGALSRDPRVFFADSPRASAPFLAHPRRPPLPRSPSLLCPFFSPFFCPEPPLRLHLPPTSTSIRPSTDRKSVV